MCIRSNEKRLFYELLELTVIEETLEEINVEKNLVNRVPSLKEVQKMIDQAAELPAKMEY